MEVEKKDSLQVFDLKVKDGLQKIVHTQDELLISSVKFYTNFGTNARVCIINDDEHETMFLEGEF